VITVLVGLLLEAVAPPPLAFLGIILALSQMHFEKPKPVEQRRLAAQEWDW
jgi:hypothetical protein